MKWSCELGPPEELVRLWISGTILDLDFPFFSLLLGLYFLLFIPRRWLLFPVPFCVRTFIKSNDNCTTDIDRPGSFAYVSTVVPYTYYPMPNLDCPFSLYFIIFG